MLVDVHAHFLHDRTGRSDWRERNASRLAAGDRIGVTWHVASILGSWGHTSPTYFPSPADLTLANDRLLALAREHGRIKRVRRRQPQLHRPRPRRNETGARGPG